MGNKWTQEELDALDTVALLGLKGKEGYHKWGELTAYSKSYNAWEVKRRRLDVVPPTLPNLKGIKEARWEYVQELYDKQHPSFIGLTIGYFDIETTFSTQPIMLYGAIADVWGNVDQFYKGKEITNDYDLVNCYARALEKYDILVSWNGKLFDIPVLSARLAYHRLPALNKGMHIDAMYLASGSSMRLGRRSLQSVSEYFNTENKKTPLSVRTWDAAMAGSEEAYQEIAEHCDSDVLVLRENFNWLKSQVTNIHR